jgi:hypothetical protein
MAREIGSVYLHIGNSGVTIGVEDDGSGPMLHIQSSTFGNNVIDQRVHIDHDGLLALLRLFDYAIEYEGYSDTSCQAAEFRWGRPFHLFEDMIPEQGCGAGASASSGGLGSLDEEDCEGGGNADEEEDKEPEKADHQWVADEQTPLAYPKDGNILGQSDVAIYYANQLVYLEIHDFSFEGRECGFHLNRTPYYPGSLSGSVCVNGVTVQNFLAQPCGEIKFETIHDEFVEKGWVSPTGLVSLYWNTHFTESDSVRIRTTYEYQPK